MTKPDPLDELNHTLRNGILSLSSCIKAMELELKYMREKIEKYEKKLEEGKK